MVFVALFSYLGGPHSYQPRLGIWYRQAGERRRSQESEVLHEALAQQDKAWAQLSAESRRLRREAEETRVSDFAKLLNEIECQMHSE